MTRHITVTYVLSQNRPWVGAIAPESAILVTQRSGTAHNEIRCLDESKVRIPP